MDFSKNFAWFTGVVEDIADPQKMNRVRVRVHGIHSDKQSTIPTSDLPWATVMMPVTAAGMSGIGASPHGLLQGSWVVGFFRDSDYAQDPIIMGTISSKFDEKPQTESFKDPDGTYPKEDYLGEPDVNRLARGEDTETGVLKAKKDSITKSVAKANGKGSWNEPATSFAAEYPHNHVVETTSGHILELDDTDGAERIHEYHKSGTFREIHPDGTIVTRIVGDDFLIVAKDNNVNIKGNVNLTIDQNCTTYIKGNWDVQVGKDMNLVIGGNQTTKIGKNRTTTSGGTDKRTSGGNMGDYAPRIDHN